MGEAAKALIRYDFVGLDHEALVGAFEACDRELNAVAAEYGLLMINETQALDGSLDYLTDHVHTTPEESRQLAAIIGEGLTPLVAQVSSEPAAADE